jgi:hypothetical protein
MISNAFYVALGTLALLSLLFRLLVHFLPREIRKKLVLRKTDRRHTGKVIIQQVSLDVYRRLRVRPSPTRPGGYGYIWRDATSVRWDELKGELYVKDNLEFTPVTDFNRIVSAVAREYGDELVLSASTAYVDLPNDIVTALCPTHRS